MPWADPFVWQAIAFSLTAVFLVTGLTWWLYGSPLPPPVPVRHPPSSRLAGWFALVLALSGGLWVIGGLWDGSMHIKTGKIPAGADFLWPPHLVIYAGFLVAFLGAATAIALIAVPQWRTGVRDPRRWVRRHPALGVVALAALYTLMAIPGDALWHALFGLDLTAWSPPHVLLGLMSAAVLASAVGLLVQARPTMQRVRWANMAILILLVLMLKQLLLLGVSEWEWPLATAARHRPLWVYPVVGGGMIFFCLSLGKQLVPYRWTATTMALLYSLLALLLRLGLQLTNNIVPTGPLPFFVGALLLDVCPWQHDTSRYSRRLLPAVAFTAGYALLALPLLTVRPTGAPLGMLESVVAVVVLVPTTLGGLSAATRTAHALVGAHKDSPQAPAGQPRAPQRLERS
jgi:hypothetical protein